MSISSKIGRPLFSKELLKEKVLAGEVSPKKYYELTNEEYVLEQKRKRKKDHFDD